MTAPAISSLAKQQQQDLVIKLIRRQMRTSLIYNLTGVREQTIRTLYREIWGVSPPAGPIPEPAGIVSTRVRLYEAAVAAHAYTAYGREGVFQGIDAEALIAGYDLYRAVRDSLPLPPGSDKPLSINHLWIIARELRAGNAEYQLCPTCSFTYLWMDQQHLDRSCPACALERRATGAALQAVAGPAPLEACPVRRRPAQKQLDFG